MKVKVIEAVRRGRPVVSSTIGAEGLPGAVRRAIEVVDAPDRFTAALEPLLTNPGAREQAERRVADAADALPTWDDAGEALAAAYGDLLAARTVA
ncbi:MAG TPA: hypothetical protein VF712_02675 [Thermoleophilaceae bacterium]|jgi:hypothetical protein